jgi:hypothetical protein
VKNERQIKIKLTSIKIKRIMSDNLGRMVRESWKESGCG